ncbi:hypothetical protein RJ641_034007 [Dillenia turbinata]|uniref:Uncharacterized protein n=1 Tax=Dillenia turbinata TaxID=194707 RepID=A0AAN8ZGM0_9MAGN
MHGDVLDVEFEKTHSRMEFDESDDDDKMGLIDVSIDCLSRLRFVRIHSGFGGSAFELVRFRPRELQVLYSCNLAAWKKEGTN